MKMRFEVRENTSDSFGVYDNNAKLFHRLIDTAISMYMRKETAEQIAEILNKEWNHFVNHCDRLCRMITQ